MKILSGNTPYLRQPTLETKEWLSSWGCTGTEWMFCCRLLFSIDAFNSNEYSKVTLIRMDMRIMVANSGKSIESIVESGIVNAIINFSEDDRVIIYTSDEKTADDITATVNDKADAFHFMVSSLLFLSLSLFFILSSYEFIIRAQSFIKHNVDDVSSFHYSNLKQSSHNIYLSLVFL